MEQALCFAPSNQRRKEMTWKVVSRCGAVALWCVFTLKSLVVFEDRYTSIGVKVAVAALIIVMGVMVIEWIIRDVRSALRQRREKREALAQSQRDLEELRWQVQQKMAQHAASQNGVDNRGHTLVRGEVIKN